jgi:hypothetical protein
MMNAQSLVIIGVIVAGAAVAASLFMFYPDMMLKNTSLDPKGEAATTAGSYGGSGATGASGGPSPSGSPQATTP